MGSDPKAAGAPGLKSRRNKVGVIVRRAWVASQAAIDLGYPQTYVRIHDDDDVSIKRRCDQLQSDMLVWLSDRRPLVVSTMAGLIRQYTLRDSSPYQRVKWNTKRTYTYVLNQMDKTIGGVKLADINLDAIVRWFNDARYPEGRGVGKPDHLRTAAGIIAMLRRLVAFGVAIEVAHCERLATILHHYRFEAPAGRSSVLTVDHVRAFIATARRMNEPALALGTALQFETTLRQKDVIGEWEPISPAGATTNYVLGGRQWVNGLTWADISDDWILSKATTKSGGRKHVTFDLRLMPLAMDLLQAIPEAGRVGPLIIDARSDRPHAPSIYQRKWREIADAAGIPRSVWNMDARSGGATEADEAGVDATDLQRAMTHSDLRTTSGYRRGEALPQTRRVANLRLVHRQKKGEVA